jgi:CubicO group peptidase (beta-lactamase class C family)
MGAGWDAVDESAARFAARGGQPGLAYGIVADGELVHAGGVGETVPCGPVPDAGTVFRIASMTKSFTASLIMLLRDEGALALDDPAQRYVPEVAGIRSAAADCPPVTIRQLLTMTGGFPTDDPWGDRQQGLPNDEFARLLREGEIRAAWAPGTRFDYSNLGYAILGRVIAAVTGVSYESAIRDRLLGPLQMDRTGFEAEEFDAGGLARGYRRDDGGWRELRPDPSGAFAPMGGVFTCVADLARWVAGFTGAFPPGLDGAGLDGAGLDGAGLDGVRRDGHPLSRASRREMQLPQVAILSGVDAPAVRFSGPASMSYGFGLFAEEDREFGAIVQHSGGYPGYGSHMRWHPATGLGAIVLANSTYARAGALAGEMLARMLQAEAARASRSGGFRQSGPVPALGRPWPETLAVRDTVNDLLQDWQDETAARLFTANVNQDRPLAQRRVDVALLRERIGKFAPDPARPAEFDSPAHCRWWLTGERGTVSVTIRLAPLREPLVQQLILAIPPAEGSALDEALLALVGVLNRTGRPEWPAGLYATVNQGEVLRQLRMASAWAGPCQVGACLAGDGASAVTVELTGPTGRVSLTVEIAGVAALLYRAEVSLLPAR